MLLPGEGGQGNLNIIRVITNSLNQPGMGYYFHRQHEAETEHLQGTFTLDIKLSEESVLETVGRVTKSCTVYVYLVKGTV